MNYFKQRRAYRKLLTDELSLSLGQNMLYRELLDYANDEDKMEKQFRLRNSVLASRTSLTEQGLAQARNRLVQEGLIEYIPGKKDKTAPTYKLIKLYKDFANQQQGSLSGRYQSVDQVVVSSVDQVVGSSVDQVVDHKYLPRLDNDLTDKRHDDDVLAKLMAYYQQNFGVTSPLIVDDLQYRIKDFDGNLDVIIEAMRRAAIDQKPYSYAKAIMTNWAKTNIKTMDQVKAADLAFEKQKAARVVKYSQNSGSKKQGVVPSWMENQNDSGSTPDRVNVAVDDELASNLDWLKNRRSEHE